MKRLGQIAVLLALATILAGTASAHANQGSSSFGPDALGTPREPGSLPGDGPMGNSRDILIIPSGENRASRVLAVTGSSVAAQDQHSDAITITVDANTEILVNGHDGSLADARGHKYVLAVGETQSDGSVAGAQLIFSDQPLRRPPAPPGVGDSNWGQPPSPPRGPGDGNWRQPPPPPQGWSNDNGPQTPFRPQRSDGSNWRQPPPPPQGSDDGNWRQPLPPPRGWGSGNGPQTPSRPQQSDEGNWRQPPPPPQGWGSDNGPQTPSRPQQSDEGNWRQPPPPPQGPGSGTPQGQNGGNWERPPSSLEEGLGYGFYREDSGY